MTNELKFIPVNIAVLTVSDSRTLENDVSGQLLEMRARSAGHQVVHRSVIPDEQQRISAVLKELAVDETVDVVISTGGTGVTGRDVTVEAHKCLYEKEITAFSTIFALVSFEKIGASAIQSRACAGVAQGTYFFALPGSPGACRDAWDSILKSQLDIRNKPCNFVEIMPRLEEHKRSEQISAG